MKFIIITLAIAVVGFGVQLVLPWWSLALVAFIIGFISNLRFMAAFAAGLLGSGSVWAAYALMLNNANESMLANKIGQLFTIPEPMLLIVISALIAGILGGLAAAGGRGLKQMIA